MQLKGCQDPFGRLYRGKLLPYGVFQGSIQPEEPPTMLAPFHMLSSRLRCAVVRDILVNEPFLEILAGHRFTSLVSVMFLEIQDFSAAIGGERGSQDVLLEQFLAPGQPRHDGAEGKVHSLRDLLIRHVLHEIEQDR